MQAQGTAPLLECAPKGGNIGIRTNPAAATNTHLPAKQNTFDWRTEYYQINWLGGTTAVENPFYQINNSSINHFYENKDMLPEDGWELFAREFGYNDNGTPSTIPVSIPTLVLYNRYTGTFRVFVMRNQYYPYTHVRFVVSFETTTGGMETTLLDQARTMDAISRSHQMGVGMQSVDRFLNEDWKWHHADFMITYDPCTCFYKSKLKVTVSFITQSQINLSGTLTGSLTNINNGSGTSAQGGFKWSWANGASMAGKFGKFFKDVADFASSFKSSVDNSAASASEKDTKKKALDTLAKRMKFGNFLKAGIKAFPMISEALGLVDFFVSGGKKPSGPQEVKMSPMAINMSIQLSGTISTANTHKEIVRWNPGSTGAIVADGEYPYYNESMGTFNLIERPVARRQTTRVRTGATREDLTWITETQYQIAQDIKWTLNPAAGLEAQEIMANFVVETNSSEAPRTDFDIWVFDGIDVASGKRRFRSPIYDIGCLKNKIVNIKSAIGADTWGEQVPNSAFFVRITANLKRIDNAPNAQNVLFTAIYPLNVEGFTGVLNPHTITPCTTLTPPQTALQVKTFCQSLVYTQGRFYTAKQIKEAEEARAEALANIIQANAYPNPTRDNLQIEIMEDANLTYEVKLYNVYGAVVYESQITQNKHNINTEKYKEGFYVLHIKSGEKEVRKRIIIKR